MRKEFSGFPARARSTPIPDLFFAEVLPRIQDLAELKTVLHILWRLFRKKGYPRFVTRAELEGDPVLRAGLGAGRDITKGLEEALGQATERGVLLRLRLERNGRREELYVLNDASGRQALERSQERGMDVGAAVVPEEPPVERPNIFALYENTIGTLTLPISEELKEAETQYPEDWIVDAFQEAAELNKPSWRYVRRILERWESEGKGSGASGRADKEKIGRYIKGKRGPLIPWR